MKSESFSSSSNFALQTWLSGHLPHAVLPFQIERLQGGQSNPTYRLQSPSHTLIMRTKPAPQAQLLPSAHAIDREYQVMSALASTSVPVPQMVGLCLDESVIGVAFYVMYYVEGTILWNPQMPNQTPLQRSALYADLAKVLATLHAQNPVTLGLADWGKTGNYFLRQINRWSKQYQASITQPIPEMDYLIEWLPQHLPPLAQEPEEGVGVGGGVSCVVHGDYRLDNVIVDLSLPSSKIKAILDWELATLGHPLADLSYHCMAWHIPSGAFRGMGGVDLTHSGIPSEDQMIEMYCQNSTQAWDVYALKAQWPYFLAYNLFRIAAILQGIAKRIEQGTAANPQAAETAKGAVPLAQLAWQFAQKL